MPGYTLMGKASQWNSDSGIVVNKTSIKICKAKERLDVANFSRFGPILNGLHLFVGHCEALGREVVPKEFHRGSVKLTYIFTSRKVMLVKAPKDFLDVILV
jgi:hypothetical protein